MRFLNFFPKNSKIQKSAILAFLALFDIFDIFLKKQEIFEKNQKSVILAIFALFDQKIEKMNFVLKNAKMSQKLHRAFLGLN